MLSRRCEEQSSPASKKPLEAPLLMPASITTTRPHRSPREPRSSMQIHYTHLPVVFLLNEGRCFIDAQAIVDRWLVKLPESPGAGPDLWRDPPQPNGAILRA
jgi:hypothetical protein